MEKLYIGRIKLSKNDSREWSGHPPFMYVTKTPQRASINKAILFRDKETCKKELIEEFKQHKHLPDSKMQIISMSVKVDEILDI